MSFLSRKKWYAHPVERNNDSYLSPLGTLITYLYVARFSFIGYVIQRVG